MPPGLQAPSPPPHYPARLAAGNASTAADGQVGQVIFSWVANTWDPKVLLEKDEAGTYIPQLVRVVLQKFHSSRATKNRSRATLSVASGTA